MQTDVIYTDFSKAFDSVNHSLLLFKLNQLGFPYNLLTWISSYLNGILNTEFNFIKIGRLYHIAAIGTIGKLVGK